LGSTFWKWDHRASGVRQWASTGVSGFSLITHAYSTEPGIRIGSKAHTLLRELPDDPSAQTATVAEIETLVHPTIKTLTRLMIQAEARRLVEPDPVSLTALDATLATLRRLPAQAETLLQQLARKR
jgi:hypothetical protein